MSPADFIRRSHAGISESESGSCGADRRGGGSRRAADCGGADAVLSEQARAAGAGEAAFSASSRERGPGEERGAAESSGGRIPAAGGGAGRCAGCAHGGPDPAERREAHGDAPHGGREAGRAAQRILPGGEQPAGGRAPGHRRDARACRQRHRPQEGAGQRQDPRRVGRGAAQEPAGGAVRAGAVRGQCGHPGGLPAAGGVRAEDSLPGRK